ncbi:MAG: tRNA 2-thiouridine(34) synthase MnmA [Candidatus Magasanikbacteria bacterium]|nr:tRNA 2-thiouridine(34) synthase MnmA [Candidatus Magasanikbacteria bacterium]
MTRIWNKHKQSNTPLKRKVFVAMSGGVDSSVAAALLVWSRKYEVVGAYMVNYDGSNAASHAIARSAAACWLPDYRDALRVAAHLGIPLLKFDFTKEYKRLVLDYMFKEYKLGRTPNPDVLCNTFIKFGTWLDKARELGFDYLATGHYARVEQDPASPPLKRGGKSTPPPFKEGKRGGLVHLLEAKDTNKDQTYFLHQLNQEQLARTMFPIGGYTKPEVRKLAKKFGLPTAEKEESMGICFVGEVPMKEFLEKKIKHKKGKIILSTGEVVGKHDGLPFYTIGQRHFGKRSVVGKNVIQSGAPARLNDISRSGGKDLPISDSRPLFVFEKRTKTNELVVGYESDSLLYKKEVALADVRWISGQSPKFPLQCEVRLRHRQPLQKAIVSLQSSVFSLSFAKPQRAVTPGQFVVFYRKGECLGGGVVV